MDDIPELLPPHLTPPIRTDADLHRLWRALMGPYGQSSRNLWFMLLHADGRMTGVLSRIDDVPERPERRMVRNLVGLCKRSLRELDGGGSAAFLLTRVGWSYPHPSDQLWAAELMAEARARRLNTHPCFLAADDGIALIDPRQRKPDEAA